MEPMTHVLITEIIRRRKALGVTQRHLAQLSGLSEITIKKIETETVNPTIKTISKMADVLGLEMRLEIKKLRT